MVGVKKIVVENYRAVDVVRDLLREYRSVKVNMKGSRSHKRKRLRADQALISAWNRRRSKKK